MIRSIFEKDKGDSGNSVKENEKTGDEAQGTPIPIIQGPRSMTSRNSAPDGPQRPACSPAGCLPHTSPHPPCHEWEDREVSSEGPASSRVVFMLRLRGESAVTD